MGKVNKGVSCSVSSCGGEAIRSVYAAKAKEAGLDVPKDSRRAYLCREHYKSLKKALREEDKLKRMRWSF